VADVRCSAVAVFVTLTTLAHGRFEDNAFLLRPPGRKVAFQLAVPYPTAAARGQDDGQDDGDPRGDHGGADAAWAAFSSSLRVEDASAYAHAHAHTT